MMMMMMRRRRRRRRTRREREKKEKEEEEKGVWVGLQNEGVPTPMFLGADVYRIITLFIHYVMGTWFAFIIFPCVASIQH